MLNFLFAEGVGLQLSTMFLCQSCGLRTAGSNCIPYRKTYSVCTCHQKPCFWRRKPSKSYNVYVFLWRIQLHFQSCKHAMAAVCTCRDYLYRDMPLPQSL